MKKDQYNSTKLPTWCPGCGNFAIWSSLKQSLERQGIAPHNVLIVYGIGCSGNMSSTIRSYGWHSLHGRAVPTAIGAKLANKNLKVIVTGGDGDGYGEGLNHFIHAMRGNVDVTYLVHDNQIYGLTTGQNSPTSPAGIKSRSNPYGVTDDPLNPIALALSVGCGYVARGFSGDLEQLTNLITEAIQYKGFSYMDIFQPCVTFNRVNTYQFFQQRLYSLQAENHDDSNRSLAWQKAQEWGDRIPVGRFYREIKPDTDSQLSASQRRMMVQIEMKSRDLTPFLKKFF